MLIWLASYPRSGNTFLRIVLNRIYGVTTTTGYNDNDPVAQMVGPAFVGYEQRKDSLQEVVDGYELTFVKTHRRPNRVECGDQPAIYVVRDGRDAIVSFAHQRADLAKEQGQNADVHQIMRGLVVDEPFGTGNWGMNILAWLRRSPPPAVIRFENLIREPENEVRRALTDLGVELPTQVNDETPSFAELNSVHDRFFRRGVVGSYRDEMPQDVQELFWAQQENAEAMALLGYDRQ